MAVTPTLDGDVLAVLASHDGIFTTGQLHRLLVRHSEEGIRKVLRRLTKQGVVESDRVGNAFTYRLNRDHLAAEYIVGLARMQKTLLERIEDRLESWQVPPVYAAVFGSVARGEMTEDSDLDLLLIRPDDADDDRWETQVDELAAEVTRWTGNDTRPLEFTEAELAGRAYDEAVLRDVARDGLTVAGSRAWLTGRLRKRNG
ncbi:nucleotidyltransferase domain-containing protein [Amycolatopsis sp. EV170708-02-1]|uniref:nucleotidyltransferase domain-containing protein n=1 Tax=Amycolatopsis sp. EV170708-02-1 TaxID=2919322 RepID=UPI001F0C6DDC|nr:nucleotidyltransferase domain-containing protein [Amycolatopsis sp. EV170708-02-1]UMP07466.1 nucleotidyltransferase domain-containing protein [Amycolatopsis sp. EV170708-02-1]